MTHRLELVLAVETIADAEYIDYDAIDAAINSIAIVLMGFLGLRHVIQMPMASSLTSPRSRRIHLFNLPVRRASASMISLIWLY
jgi:hypothetical protein